MTKGKYQYEGEVWIPANDIISLGKDNLYIVFEVPESMKDDASSSIMLTFTIDGNKFTVNCR